MAKRNNEKPSGGLPVRADWGDTIPNTNYAIGLTEFFFYSLLAAGAVGAAATLNIFEFHADAPMTINPVSDWRNPVTEFQNMLAAKPFEAAVFRNSIIGVGGALLIWMLLRSAYTSGAWASDKVRGR